MTLNKYVSALLFAALPLFAIFIAQPAPAANGGCDRPFSDATVVQAVAPNYPDSARKLKLGPVTVLVNVTIGANGNLVATSIAHSSGNANIDQEALRAARQSTYRARTVNCAAVAGTYLFRADFNPKEAPVPNLPPLVPIPSMSAPPGWITTDLTMRNAAWQTFSIWGSGKRRLSIGGGPTTGTLDGIRKNATAALRMVNADITVDRLVKICGGTQDAWMIVYERTDRTNGITDDFADVTAVRGQDEYRADYYVPAHEPPDASVLASMTSMCVPAAAAAAWAPPVHATPMPVLLLGKEQLPSGWYRPLPRYATWNDRAGDVISVLHLACPEQCRNQKPPGANPTMIVLARNEEVHICGGQQRAWLREYKRPSGGHSISIDLFPSNLDDDRTLTYTGFVDEVPRDIFRAMLAACTPYETERR